MNAASGQRFDAIVVGAGLAGSLAALALCRRGYGVLVLDAGIAPGGASNVAAGIVNPYAGLRARPMWRADEAWSAFRQAVRETDATFAPTGVLRPARDAAQARLFREAARSLGEEAAWLAPGAARERFPGLSVHGGALFVRRGGMIRPDRFVRAVLAAAEGSGARLRETTPVLGFGEEDSKAFVTVRQGRITADLVVLCTGYGYRRFAELRRLNLHAVKGQVVHVARPAELPPSVEMPVSGHGYVAPQGDRLVVGTSYERSFDHVRPTEEEARRILQRASAMWPPLAAATVLGRGAGVRVTTPGTRLPVCGPVPGRRRIWVIAGLGSKGLLMSSLLARGLPGWLENPASVPRPIRPALGG